MSVEGQRLLKQAATFAKMGDFPWALNLLERSFDHFIGATPREYASAAEVKTQMALIHVKKGNNVTASECYTKSGDFYEKAKQKRLAMASLCKAAYLCIEERALWDALFLFERVSEYYVKVDAFKCSELSFDACLCIIAMGQMSEIAEVFEIYCGRITYEEKLGVIKKLLETHETRKPLVKQEWFSMVFNHLS